jgi:hypothetical protein
VNAIANATGRTGGNVAEPSFHQGGQHMRIYIFKSEKTDGLRAFAGDLVGARLPYNHAPWTATGVVGEGREPPHKLSRETIEEAIETDGFQLWRLNKKALEAQA